MTDNIVSTISRFLTPELISKLASATGLDRTMAHKATAAAVPAILTGLADMAAKGGGARQLANAVAEQPSDLLGSIANSLSGAQQMADKGASQLSTLLGGGMQALLASTIGRFLGIGEAPVRMLLGLITPIILGVLGREQRAQSLDATGLARLLGGQRDEIASAMPAGLTRLMQEGGFKAGTASASERPAYETRSANLRVAGETAPASSGARWAYWALPLLALAGLIWFLFPKEERTVEAVPATQTTSLPARATSDALVKVTFLTTAPQDWTSIGTSPNEYTNQDVYNTAGENLGTIRDLLIGPDGKAAAAIINVGRFLGIGDKEIAVPFSALHIVRQGDSRRIVIDAVKDGVQAAPTFTRRASAKP
jgi:Bacterial protein of unknown function (DUF937)/PRC-barrel domain